MFRRPNFVGDDPLGPESPSDIRRAQEALRPPTRAELKDDTRSINANTWISFTGQIAVVAVAVWWLVTLMITPMKEQMKEVRLDIRELYKVSPSQRSDRLERPVEATK